MTEEEQQSQEGSAAAADAATAGGEAAGGKAGHWEAPERPPHQDPGGARPLLAAAVTLPWTALYGVTGVWAVTLAARAASDGLKRVDAGYTRYVTPPQLAFVGALLLAAFAAMLACALLLLFRQRSGAAWLPLLLVSAGLTAGAAWAGVRGGLHPLLWLFLFFGLVYVVVVALLKLLQMTRTGRRGRIGPP